MLDLDTLDFGKGNGLVTVVAQDAASGTVLMVAHADREALERTVASGEMHYRSRTRGLWHKGATSGNVQRVVSLSADCDGDAVLARVRPAGPACHTGSVSCFGDAALAADALGMLDATVRARATALAASPASPASPAVAARGAPPESHDHLTAPVAHHPPNAAAIAASPPGTAAAAAAAATPPPRPSYTQRLLADRNLRLKKLGEEAAELVLACADGDGPRAAEEGADLLYHTLVALRAAGVSLDDVRRVLAERAAG
ncbi:MAG TPA: phosphoribosyl-ATP diphosphatase [Gemmatimonadaceae bacterium]|nr:phosphoribosyl-ATP diphosphatase [Gemmatimonadaceae bacterium]